MDRIEQSVRDLIEAIQNSDDYVRFCAARDKLREDPKLRSQVNEFRVNVFEMQNSQELLDPYTEQQRLCREAEEFRRNSLVDEFLHAELAVCRILQKMVADIVEAVDLDIDEIAERIDL